MTDELISQIMMARERMLRENGRPHVVVLNDALFKKDPILDGETPTVCGMKVEYSPLPSHIHFIIKESFPISNADRIRSMTDEELAWFIYTKTGCDHKCMHWNSKSCTNADTVKVCGEIWLDWLKQECET